MKKGFSLIETLIVVGIFAVVGIIVAQSSLISIRNTRKSDAINRVRNNLEYVAAIMERQLRSASSVTSCTATEINYVDANNKNTFFRCGNLGSSSSYVASDSATTFLTRQEVVITNCTFACTPATIFGTSPSISINISGVAKDFYA